MFRALRTRTSPSGYDQLGFDDDEATNEALVPKSNRPSKSRTLFLPPGKIILMMSCSFKKVTKIGVLPTSSACASSEKVAIRKASKVHPFFSLFESRRCRKKKATARPEFSRYAEYMKEGGAATTNWEMIIGKKPSSSVVYCDQQVCLI